MAENLLDLVTELCDVCCRKRSQFQPFVQLTSYQKERHKKRSRLIVLDAVFSHLQGLHQPTELREPMPQKHAGHGPIEQLYSCVFDRRMARKFDDANKLEHLIDTLNCDETSLVAKAMLQLLLLLSDSKKPAAPVLGHNTISVPLAFPENNVAQVLPVGPLNYGDTRVYQMNVNYYMHYPPEVFELPGNTLLALTEDTLGAGDMLKMLPDFSIFEATPGTDLQGSGLFKPWMTLHDSYEKTNQMSLFGALVQSKSSRLDTVLEMPDLPDVNDISLYETRISKLPSELSEDEGFLEASSSITSSVSLTNDLSSEEDIWEAALKAKPNCHFTWEDVGSGTIAGTQKPYASEAGPECLSQLYIFWQDQLSMLDPSFLRVTPHLISSDTIVKDAINVMLGVPSYTFPWDESSQSFFLQEGLYLSGTTPEGLESACSPLVECGTNYMLLSQFSKPLLVDSLYDKGLIFQAFTGAIRKYLQHYRGCVLSIPSRRTLMQLLFMVGKLMGQLRYLVQLCKCGADENEGNESDQIPLGVGLLSYLYQECLDACGLPHYPMLLSLLQASCQPYLGFVQEWVFSGVCQDIYGEFMIQVQEHYLELRDKHYWTHGYVMTTKNVSESVPAFLGDLAKAIFVCGKSINLLRLCNPQHFMFVFEHEAPQVAITFSADDLMSSETRCDMYTTAINDIARQKSKTRLELLAAAEYAKQELRVKARKFAAEQISRIQGQIQAARQAAQVKKQAAFAELKSQMEADLRRRATIREEERTADSERMARVMKQELLEIQGMDHLEEQAKADLEAKYREMMEDAERREQKALWRVQRRKLDLARRHFMASERANMRTQMESMGMDLGDLDEVDARIAAGSGSPPAWAQREGDRTLMVTDEDEDLPGWAKRAAPPFGLNLTSQEELPSWARDEQGTVRNVHPSDASVGSLLQLPGEDAAQNKFHRKPPEKKLRPEELPSAGVSGSPPEDGMLHTRPVDGKHVTEETKNDVTSKLALKPVEGQHASRQTVEEAKIVVSKKAVKGLNIMQESTEEAKLVSTKKTVEGKGVMIQSSEESELVHQKKSVPGKHMAMQSTEDAKQISSVKMSETCHTSMESKQIEEKPKKRNFFGHVSKLSGVEYDMLAPRLKRPPVMAIEDKWCYQIKPNRQRKSVKEDDVDSMQKPTVTMNKERYATKESEYVDMDLIRSARFRIQNIHGHASDSTVQKLLYPQNVDSKEVHDRVKGIDELEDEDEIVLWTDLRLERYQDDYDMFGLPPMVDLLAQLPMDPNALLGNFSFEGSEDVTAHEFISLPSLLKRAVTAPLTAQISLVNRSLVNYFLVDLDFDGHLNALRNYLFLQDGEFGQCLSDQLFEKLSSNPSSQEMLNPVYLGHVLSRALQYAAAADDRFTANMSFSLRHYPPFLQPISVAALDCLDLVYKVDWPMNIVITDTCLGKYGQIFTFMLQLKRAVWVTREIWHRLKRDAHVHGLAQSPQLRQLQLFRHVMQHFVKVMQGYISSQVIDVTWQEFQEELASSVRTLEDLHETHAEYLNTCIFRCLLNKKAAPVMKIIHDIFGLILKFRGQLMSAEWRRDLDSGQMIHPAFMELSASFQAFREFSHFLFKVVNKLAQRGYQPHFQELLLRLNFNSHYQDST